MLPKRADPVAGSLVGTIVLAAFLAPLLLAVALIAWLVIRARRWSPSSPKPDEDPEFTTRFHALEESLLKPTSLDSQGTKPAARRPRGARAGRRVVRHQ